MHIYSAEYQVLIQLVNFMVSFSEPVSTALHTGLQWDVQTTRIGCRLNDYIS